MADLEEQLHHYADYVESTVGLVASPYLGTSPRGRFPLIFAAAVVVALIAAGVVWLPRGSEVETDPSGVPDVSGLSMTDAIAALSEAGIKGSVPQVDEPHEEIVEGDVIRTDPPVNTLVPANSSVPIFEAVPLGSSLAGQVLSQDPAGFEEVDLGSAVTITVGEPTPP